MKIYKLSVSWELTSDVPKSHAPVIDIDAIVIAPNESAAFEATRPRYDWLIREKFFYFLNLELTYVNQTSSIGEIGSADSRFVEPTILLWQHRARNMPEAPLFTQNMTQARDVHIAGFFLALKLSNLTSTAYYHNLLIDIGETT